MIALTNSRGRRALAISMGYVPLALAVANCQTPPGAVGLDAKPSPDACSGLPDPDSGQAAVDSTTGADTGPQLKTVALTGSPLTMDFVTVPAGDVEIGRLCSWYSDDTWDQQTVFASAFQIGRTEVSVQQYAAGVAAGAVTPAKCRTGVGCADPNNPAHAKLPQAWVTWQQADSFCRKMVAGGHLPSELQWVKAARGGCGLAGQRKCNAECAFATDGPPMPEALAHTMGKFGIEPLDLTLAQLTDPVFLYAKVDDFGAGAGPYGTVNTVGNVSEWVHDFAVFRGYAWQNCQACVKPHLDADFVVTQCPDFCKSKSPACCRHLAKGGTIFDGYPGVLPEDRPVERRLYGPTGFRCAIGP